MQDTLYEEGEEMDAMTSMLDLPADVSSMPHAIEPDEVSDVQALVEGC